MDGYLFPDAGEDDNEGDEERYEDDAEGDGGHVTGHSCPVGVVVQRRTAVVTESVEPTSHFIWFLSSSSSSLLLLLLLNLSVSQFFGFVSSC